MVWIVFSLVVKICDGFFQFNAIVVVSVCCIEVMFLCCDMFGLSWIRVNFHKVMVRIAMCSSVDHGFVCLV